MDVENDDPLSTLNFKECKRQTILWLTLHYRKYLLLLVVVYLCNII